MDIHVHDLHKFHLCVKCGLKRMEQPGQRCEHCTKEKAKAARSLAEFLASKKPQDHDSEKPTVQQTCLAF